MLKKLKIIAMILLFLNLLGLVEAKRLKIATLVPEGSFWMEKMRAGAAKIKKDTQGRIKLKFYPGGVMGDDKAVLRKIKIGQLQGGMLVSGNLAKFYRDCEIYGLPFKFKSFDEVDFVRQKMDTLIMTGLEKGGLINFGLVEGGFAYVMSTAQIKSISTLRQQKVWIPDTAQGNLAVARFFGITPIPLSIADVRTGLQTGLINTVATSPAAALALQWHTQVKYLLDEPFMYLYGVLVIDAKAFKKLLSQDQGIIRREMISMSKEINQQARRDNQKARKTLRGQGIKFTKLTPEEAREYYQKATDFPQYMLKKKQISGKMLNLLEQYLKAFRSQRQE